MKKVARPSPAKKASPVKVSAAKGKRATTGTFTMLNPTKPPKRPKVEGTIATVKIKKPQ